MVNHSKLPLILLVLLLTTAQLFAKVAYISLETLIEQSESIVVAKVEKVSKPLFGKRYAKAKVTEVWKGSRIENLEFLASRTWTCDISSAEKGETALLFLTKGKESRSHLIAHSGRGRMPQQVVRDKLCVRYWGDLQLPEEIMVVDTSGEYAWIRYVEISALKNFVKRQVEKGR